MRGPSPTLPTTPVSDSSHVDPSRRRILGAVGAGAVLALAGCLGQSPADEPDRSLAVEVRNETSTTQQYTVTVLADDVTVLTLADQRVAPDVNARHEPGDLTAPNYEIRVRGDNWATAGTWNPAACPAKTFVTTLTADAGTPDVTVETDCAEEA